MKNLIYQYWDGNLTPGCLAGSTAMKQYGNRIGAEYLFEHNPRFVTNLGSFSPHYGSFKLVYDKQFQKYDNVLFTDTDVFPIEGLTENIFENFDAEIGICTEPFQPKQRAKSSGAICGARDEKWAAAVKSHWNVDMPRTSEGLLKVYNSGVVLYSNKGLIKARQKFVPFKEYVNLINSKNIGSFYTSDQSYLHAMLHVCKMNYVELDNGWNNYVHHYYTDTARKTLALNDSRTKNTKFVHIQLRSADHWDAQKLWRITNRPVEDWGL